MKGTVQSNSTIRIIAPSKLYVFDANNFILGNKCIWKAFLISLILITVSAEKLGRLLCTYLLKCDVEVLIYTDALFQEGLLSADAMHSFQGYFPNFVVHFLVFREYCSE